MSRHLACDELEVLLCDYLDNTLAPGEREAVQAHLESCASCAELARDASAGVAFLDRVDAVEPPSELVTKILYQAPTAQPASEPAGRRSWFGWLRGLFEPILQPRFAMGMAMTILSFSMIGRFAGISQRQITAADLDPVRIWASLDAKVHRTYDRAVKYYENLRLVYEIQNRLREWSDQEEQAQAAQDRQARRTVEPAPDAQPAAAGDQRNDERSTR